MTAFAMSASRSHGEPTWYRVELGEIEAALLRHPEIWASRRANRPRRCSTKRSSLLRSARMG